MGVGRDGIDAARCSCSLSAYSAASPAWRLLAMTWSPPLAMASAISPLAVSSNSIRLARSSVLRADPGDERDDDDAEDEAGRDGDAVGLLDHVVGQGVQQDKGQQLNPSAAAPAAARRAAMVTANAAETIMARIPVA